MSTSPLRTGILCTAFLLGIATSLAQPISLPEEFRQQSFDVMSYDADIRFESVTDRNVKGVVRMAVRWTAAPSSPLLYAHLLSCTFDSVLVRGQRVEPVAHAVPVGVSDTMHYYSFAMPHNVAVNDLDTLVMYYGGVMTNEGGAVPWGGVHYEDEVLYALGVGFHAPQVGTTQHWMPCYDHPSDKARFRARFDVPKGFDVASVGLRTNDVLDGNRRVIEWTTSEDFATYLLTFAAAPYELLASSEGTVPIEIYALARDTTSAQISFKLLPRMIRALAARYGAYPFEKVGYCITSRGAMEHQTMISFPVSIVQRRDSVNDVAAHELAHQWFGDLVTPLDFRHAWLTESFATFSENVWREDLYGFGSYLGLMKGRVDQYIATISKREGLFPLHHFKRDAPSSNYPETIYHKGAVVLGMLRHIMGDSAFFGGLRLYLQQHYNGNAVTSDMKTALETASGLDLTPFFEQWVYGIGWPKLKVTYVRNGLGWNVTMDQVQNQLDPMIPVFTTLPLNIKMVNANDVNIDTVLMADANGRFAFSCKKLTGVNNGNLLRSLVEIVQTVGVDESATPSRTITLSPNPAADLCVIDRSISDFRATLNVIDSAGRTLLTKFIEPGVAQQTLSLSELASGSYVVTVTDDVASVSVPLIVSR